MNNTHDPADDFDFWGEPQTEDVDWQADPTEGVAASLQYLFPRPETPDQWGVSIEFDEDVACADVILAVPTGLPARVRDSLAELERQRVLYTDEDREIDAERGVPADDWDHATPFAERVHAAWERTRRAVHAAVWAHAWA